MELLVIEDSERLLRSLDRGLTKAGYSFDLAAGGKEGLAFAETYEYEAIVLDLMVPGLPGLERFFEDAWSIALQMERSRDWE